MNNYKYFIKNIIAGSMKINLRDKEEAVIGSRMLESFSLKACNNVAWMGKRVRNRGNVKIKKEVESLLKLILSVM